MNAERRALFLLSMRDKKYFKDKQVKFELLTCAQEGQNCTEHRSAINNYFLASHRYLLNKDYPRSIEALKNSFYKCSELQESSCMKCTEIFRSAITESLEYIHLDLHRMTTGLFRRKHYQTSYKMAGNILAEFKNDIPPGKQG